MTHSNQKTLTLQSTRQEINRLKPFLKELREWSGFGEEKFSEVRLALNEAVMNAINHGNKNDASKKVHIRSEKTADKLVIHVKDEGNGFDVNDIPNPTDADNILKPSGRGVFLIRQQADEVSFSKEDATMTMKFNLE